MTPTFQMGQKLVFVPSDTRHPPHSVIVEKIGRKWIGIRGVSGLLRFDIKTFRVDGDGYSSPGNVWLSWTALENEQKRIAMHKELRQLTFGHDYPFTREQLNRALDILTRKDASID